MFEALQLSSKMLWNIKSKKQNNKIYPAINILVSSKVSLSILIYLMSEGYTLLEKTKQFYIFVPFCFDYLKWFQRVVSYYFGLVKILLTLSKSGWIADKEKEKRWKAKLHLRSLFRTSNRVCPPAASGAPGGRSCNFLAKRGWTCGQCSADIKDTRPRKPWHTHSFCLCLWHLGPFICFI